MDKLERRSSSRIPLVATITLAAEDQPLLSEALVRDVSLDGLFVCTSADLSLNRLLNFTLVIRGESSTLTITGDARIIRKGSDGLALRFAHLQMDSYLYLKNIVHYWQGPASA